MCWQADSLGAIRESVKNVSKSIHAHGNGGGMHLAKFSDGQEFEDIPGVSDKTCQTLIDTHYAGKPKAKARAASTATATEDPHSMKVGAKATLAGSVESVAVETSWENDMDLMAGVALYTRGKKREGFCYQEQKTPTIHDLGGQPCVDLVRFDPDSAQVKRARRPQVIKLDLANISHDVTYIVLYAACESAKKFTGVRGLSVAIKDTTHGDGKHTQVAAFDTSDFADKSTASMVLGMFKAVVDRRDTSKRIGWEFIKDGRAASKDLGLTWRLVSPTPPSHLEPLFLKHLQYVPAAANCNQPRRLSCWCLGMHACHWRGAHACTQRPARCVYPAMRQRGAHLRRRATPPFTRRPSHRRVIAITGSTDRASSPRSSSARPTTRSPSAGAGSRSCTVSSPASLAASPATRTCARA